MFSAMVASYDKNCWRRFFAGIVLAMVCPMAIANSVIEAWTSNRNSYDLHAVAADRFVIEEGRHGSFGKIARFTVEPGDVFNKSTGERSDVVLGGWEPSSRFRVTGDEGVEFYRVSVKLAPDWQSPQKNSKGYMWGSFFHLHGPNQYAASEAVGIHAEDKFSLFVLAGDLDKPAGGRRFLTKSDLNVGKWVDFILEIKWAYDSTGAIAVYRRDEGDSDWEKVSDIRNLATLQFRGNPIPNSHYWKAGFYRSESNHINTLWLGPVIRGETFAEVAGK